MNYFECNTRKFSEENIVKSFYYIIMMPAVNFYVNFAILTFRKQYLIKYHKILQKVLTC